MKKIHKIILGVLVLIGALYYFNIFSFTSGNAVCPLGVDNTKTFFIPVDSEKSEGFIGYVRQGSRICVRNKVTECNSIGWWETVYNVFSDVYCPFYSPACDRAEMENLPTDHPVFPSMSNKWCYHPNPGGLKSNCVEASCCQGSYRESGDCPALNSGATITRLNGEVYRLGSLNPANVKSEDITLKSIDLTQWVKVSTVPAPSFSSLIEDLNKLWNDFINYLKQIWESLKFFTIVANYNIGDTFTMTSTSSFMTTSPVIDEDYSDGTITQLYGKWVLMKNGVKIEESQNWIKLSQQTYTYSRSYTCQDNAKIVLATAIFKASNTYDMSTQSWGQWQVSKVAEDKKSYICGVPPVTTDPISQLTSAWNDFINGLKQFFCDIFKICL